MAGAAHYFFTQRRRGAEMMRLRRSRLALPNIAPAATPEDREQAFSLMWSLCASAPLREPKLMPLPAAGRISHV